MRFPPNHEIDPESYNLIVQLAEADLKEAQDSADRKGKRPAGTVTDDVVAIKHQLEELKIGHTLNSDSRMARSIAAAVASDADALTQTRNQERQADADRLLARRLAGGPREDQNPDPPITNDKPIDEKLLAQLAAKFVSNNLGMESDREGDDNQNKAESSASSARKALTNPTRRNIHCVSCMDSFAVSDLAAAPCGDNYCRTCLSTLFTESFRDQSLFPPRCCGQEFNMHDIDMFLPGEILVQFEEKKIEYSTKSRTYCAGCGSFVRPEAIANNIATCKTCQAQTCVHCSNDAHEGDCTEDLNRMKTLELAKEKGWKQCPGCQEMVELAIGCNHMKCRCGTQFCYVCGAQWKTCECEQWDEDNLFLRAGEVVDREERDRRRGEQRDRLVGQLRDVAEYLRENHECDHDNWVRVPGRHSCDSCGMMLWKYIYQCNRCRMEACGQCRYNRL